MGFDIRLDAGTAVGHPQATQGALLEQFEALENFAFESSDENDQIWEIYAPQDRWVEAIITAWPDCVYLEIHSTPLVSCEDELSQIKPILDFLISRGYILDYGDDLLAQYKQQGGRVQDVIRILNQ